MAKRKRKTKDHEHYVCNKDIYNAIKTWYETPEVIAHRNNKELRRPKMPEYIGDCISRIANNFSFKPNFIGYTYKDEMIDEAILTCIRYALNFKTEHPTQNPFAYFSQVVSNAFIKVIKTENKQQEILFNNTMNELEHGEIGKELKSQLKETDLQNYFGVKNTQKYKQDREEFRDAFGRKKRAVKKKNKKPTLFGE